MSKRRTDHIHATFISQRNGVCAVACCAAIMDEKEAGGGDVDALVDLMESELGTSSQKQDVSARSKFNAFLDRHVDPDVAWQTSMNYVSSIKRQLEVATGTKLFQSELELYKRCRRHLSKRYLQEAISTGKKLKEQAPAMTMDDLRVISKILFVKNDKKALMDRTLLTKQWLAIGRSSDVGSINFSDLHWHDYYILIDITRIKVRQQQSISIFCSPKCWSIDPFHALASQLVADPYNASPRVFSRITESSSDSHVAAYINRLLKSLYEFDRDVTITRNLQSHSSRRGGAAFASADPSVNLSDLAHRGLWSMDGFATLLEYISPTSSGDQNIAKVLGGWTGTKQAGMPPTLTCFEVETYQMRTRVNAFAKQLRMKHFVKLERKGFADCLTASLLMYYRDTLAVAADHIVNQELQRVHTLLSPQRSCQEELLQWGDIIRKRFVSDNILLLTPEQVKENLMSEQQAQQFFGVHTFADTRERMVVVSATHRIERGAEVDDVPSPRSAGSAASSSAACRTSVGSRHGSCFASFHWEHTFSGTAAPNRQFKLAV